MAFLPVVPFAGFAAADAAHGAASASPPAWGTGAMPVGAPTPGGSGLYVGTGHPSEAGTAGPRSEAGEAPSEAGARLCPPCLLPPMTSLQLLPATYGELQSSVVVPGCFKVFAGKLGMSPTTPLAHFLAVPEEDMLATIQAIIDEGGMDRPMERGELVFSIRHLFALAGVMPPSLGAAGLPAAPTVRVPSQLAFTQGRVPDAPPVQPNPVLSIPLRKYVDQSLDGVTAPMAQADLTLARARFEQVNDGEPEPEVKPTAEQLAALQAVVVAGRAPYTDFAVWNVWGPRLAKHQDTDATVLVGSSWVTRRIQAPNSYTAWKSSWELFETAMISLGYASRGALGRYSKGIEKLTRLFPSSWDIILTSDLLVRSEKWQALREKYSRHGAEGYDVRMPWSYVLSMSAFGSADLEMASWWSTMLVIPCSSTSTSGAAHRLIGDVEGLMPEHLRGRAASSRDGLPALRDRSRSPRRADRPAAARSSAPCYYWNRRLGQCAAMGALPPGLRARHLRRVQSRRPPLVRRTP